MQRKAKIKLLQMVQRGQLPKEALFITDGTCFMHTENDNYQLAEGCLNLSTIERIREIVDMRMITIGVIDEQLPYAVVFRDLPEDTDKSEAQGWIVPRFGDAICKSKELASKLTEIIMDTRQTDELATEELCRRIEIHRRARGEHMCPKCRYIEKLEHDVKVHVCPHCKYEQLYA